MQGGEALSTIAQVGLGLAGFTGILVWPWSPPRSGSFLFGLLWLLFIASLQFARILFVRGPGA